MRISGRWPIALPLYESADGLGAGAPPPPDDGMVSLSDHESDFSPEAQRAPEPDPDAEPGAPERGERGRFAPRHRAASQRADADDVPAIAEQSKRIRDIEARLGADITRKEGESERVYTLRRRAELLERQSVAPQAQPVAGQPAPTPTALPQPVQRQPVAQSFPSSEQFFAQFPDATWEDYTDARADWRYEVRAQQDRERQAAETQQRTEQEQGAAYTAALAAAKAKYADYDAVVTGPNHPVNLTIVKAIMASKQGPDIAYLLAKDHELRTSLNAETTEFHASAVAPMRRYLDSLVAGQRALTPTRTAAGPTGAALALAQPPAPRPPTPVRTGTIAAPDTPPGDDDMSIDAHQRHFGPSRRYR